MGLIESTHVNETELSKYLDSINEKSLPTSVFMEIMVHFRDDSARLRKIIEFRLSKGLPLFNNISDYCISEDEITCIYHMHEISKSTPKEPGNFQDLQLRRTAFQ